MQNVDSIVEACTARAGSRLELWTELLNALGARRVAEIGVYRGDFAARILERCQAIERYYLIDPWRHLDDWNKPANKGDDVFESFLAETKAKTEFAAHKRVVLRGKTTEVIDEIADGELDFAYIDGDHTLKGIAIDLIRAYPKVKAGGWIGGDDFKRSMWQHGTSFEPTLVFPFAVHFAEAVGARIVALPFSQFLLQKGDGKSFEFVDSTGHYGDAGLKAQLSPQKMLKLRVVEVFPFVRTVAHRARKLAGRPKTSR